MVFASICGHASSAFFFLRARAVIKYVLRAASTLKNSCGEQRAFRKLSGQNLNLSLLKETFCAK